MSTFLEGEAPLHFSFAFSARDMRSYSRFNLRLIKRYDQWMVAQHYSAGTKTVYRQSLRLFIEFLKHKSLTEVAHLDIRKFMLHLSEMECPSTAHIGTCMPFEDSMIFSIWEDWSAT